MRRQATSSKNLTTENSTIILPKATPLKNKLTSTLRLKSTPRSLNESSVSLPASISTPRIKKANSFYNDHNRIYLYRSRILSEKNQSFQQKPLTFSERKRYQSQRTQQIIRRRQLTKSCEPKNHSNNFKNNRQTALDRFHQVASSKYKKLVYGQQMVKVNKMMLEKGIKRSMSEKSVKKWNSPFKGESYTQKLRGKPLVSKQLEPLLPPGNPTQLKVLNLDRLFRMRDGQLSNVVPLPVAKLSQVNSRQYLIKAVKHQDKIHQAIRQYNNLLKLGQLEKTKPRLGIKGTRFTKAPTIQQLMGLKINPSKTIPHQNAALLEPQTFIKHCKHYQNCVKQDTHLNRRIMAGLTRDENSGNLSLSAFTLFWQLFISRTAKIQEKVQFLGYFFLPVGQQKIELSVLKLIFEIMCKELPPIQKLDLRTDLLSMQEKSKIFLQALTRVLFADLQYLDGRSITRSHLSQVLMSNPDACDLLIRLLQVDS